MPVLHSLVIFRPCQRYIRWYKVHSSGTGLCFVIDYRLPRNPDNKYPVSVNYPYTIEKASPYPDKSHMWNVSNALFCFSELLANKWSTECCALC